MKTRTIRIGSRDSRLALIQTNLIADAIRRRAPGVDIDIDIVPMKTTGDRILDQTLDKVGGKGLFVKELDQALRDGRVDLCVHSYKDLPVPDDPDLPILAASAREDPRDALVLPLAISVPDMSRALGSSSQRRCVQLVRLFPEWRTEPVRGNVLTRLKKLDAGEYGGLALAAAGLIRLGLRDRIARVFTPEELLPAAGQGILAVQGRAGESFDFLDAVNDRDAADAVRAERAFVERLGGGCSSPTAAYAEIRGGALRLTGMHVDADGVMHTRSLDGDRDDARAVGVSLAESLLTRSANGG